MDRFYAALGRRLPRRLLMDAYAAPMTVEDLQTATGVPVPYLRDEITILSETGLIEPASGGRYETRLPILDRDLSAETDRLFAGRCPEIADLLYRALVTHEGAIRGIGFHGADMERPKLLWLAPNILSLVLEYRVQPEILTYYPLTKTGAHAWLYGTEDEHQAWGAEDRQRRDDDGHELLATDLAPLDRLADRPYARTATSRWPALALLARMTDGGLSVAGLTAEEASECAGLVEAGLAVQQDGRLVSSIPVFTPGQYRSLWSLIRDEMGFLESGFRGLHEEVASVMRAHLPGRFHDRLRQYAFLRMLRAKSFVYEAFFAGHRIPVPEGAERHSYALVIVPSEVPTA